MSWETEYPTVAVVNSADVNTLLTWEDNLHQPETDVERTVMRKIKKRAMELIGKEVRQENPDIAEKWNELDGLAEKLGLGSIGKM